MGMVGMEKVPLLVVTSSCNSVHCSSGMAHTSPGVSKFLCHCLPVVTSRTCALLFCSALC